MLTVHFTVNLTACGNQNLFFFFFYVASGSVFASVVLEDTAYYRIKSVSVKLLFAVAGCECSNECPLYFPNPK